MIENILPTSKIVVDLEMLQVDYNEQKKEALRHEIAKKYNVPLKNVVVELKPITVTSDGQKLSLASDIIKSVQDPRFQQQLFRDYAEAQGLENVDFDEIDKIDNFINSFVDFDSYSKFKNYRLKYLKWSNYLSYGPDNYVDFTKLHGLVLLNGSPENQSGKTTFSIDLPRFGLFGKAKKSPTLNSVFNIYNEEATEVVVEEGIEIDGVDYVIKRTIKRPALNRRRATSKPTQTIEYYRKTGDSLDLIENCEAEDVAQTNNIIRDSVGSVDDFNLVISANVKTLGELLELSQANKSKLFSRWLGLVTIEEKERIAKEHYKTRIAPKLKSNSYNSTVVQNEVNDFKAVVASNVKQIETLEQEKKAEDEAIAKIEVEKTKVMEGYRAINEELTKTDITSLNMSIANAERELEDKRVLFRQDKADYIALNQITFDLEAYRRIQQEIGRLQQENGGLNATIVHKQGEIAHITQLIQQGICPNCGQKVDTDNKSRDIEERQREIESLTNQINHNNGLIRTYNQKLVDMDNDRKSVEKCNQVKIRLQALKANIENIKLQIENLQKRKKDVEDNQDNIKHNNEIRNKVATLDERIRVERGVRESKVIAIQRLQSDNENHTKQIEQREKLLEVLNEEAKTIRNWNIYNKLVGKDGIVKMVLKRALPILNNEIARLLNGLCDFDVVLSVNDDNNVCMDLVRDGKNLDMTYACSGFEGTISALALRCALSNMAVLAKPNFLTLDEILSGISSQNMENIMTLFRRVLHSYDFILHICHDTTIVDYHDQIVTVTKQDNMSVIEVK